ncbi:glycosyltransferase family A protein [Paracoccus sp. CPCC 101403]|uniref:Glycosyltransferase family A protein n=2 Tax=Paracoccus broussonetiae TaxID=3075834 RepID=A0ABU3EG94_9RHOB|nr:glycosyltransferase family A protein [Paracoccus sp. CPCC 101403]MDT1063259.1 glycosyltransferase family A protein [Paracoccus sp. CPCC 101403]
MHRQGGASATVIVVSRHRPRELERCLSALTRQTHPHLEVVLVADPASLQTLPDLPLKRVSCDVPNISVARNLGLALAAGEVVLFIDDDALAEPGWALALTRPFADPRVMAATGFTRGPDGLAWQVRAERITPSGQSYEIEVSEAQFLGPEEGAPVSTVGTNCAFRRSTLLEIGGFDPAFAYHLDESDVNLRLAERFPVRLTAVIPEAEVIHGLAPGVSRAVVGVPHDLSAIGRSTAFFAARHGGDVDWLRQAQRQRLLRHMVAGRLDPLQVGSLLATLESGIAEAAAAGVPPDPVWTHPAPPAFQPFPASPPGAEFIWGWHWNARKLRARAADAVAEGKLVTLLLLTPTFLPHRLTLRDGGWWEQYGGVWGASRPGDSHMILMTRSARIAREWGFFAAVRR